MTLDVDLLCWRLKQLKAPKDFILVVLLVIWTADSEKLQQDYTFLEFYAGNGNLHRMMRAAGKYRAARFDILDGPSDIKRSNYMDLNSRSGFANLDSTQYSL
ncbi:hypothetical protein AK812_SmicGene46094 [Symbiodinium microadriaticum]|uniref:Uncharacterized protein n=1 Tax=Symbiodinium microadriaticum TaxID=2951 RepID=A0A1Q9BUN8_SYMMI|nr:hypothetical protein AK812_SmicGene46094 [Symbiodinium microadriaticum]